MPELLCERCGAAQDNLIEITALGDLEPRYVSGSPCPTPGCGTTCPICQRPVGDVHSGACAPIVLAKLTDRTRVSREDCLMVLARAS